MLTNYQESYFDPKDYRTSHSTRGADYDEMILSSPLDAYMDKWETRRLDQLIQKMFRTRIPRYLDFACGTGRITQRFERISTESFGIDVSQSMLNVAQSKCNRTQFFCADLTRESLDLGQFDVITAFRFFGNAQDELRHAALQAIHGRLRKGGYLIFNNHRNPFSLLQTARRLSAGLDNVDLSYSKLKGLLNAHGFKIVEQRPIGFWIYRFKIVTNTPFLSSRFAATMENIFRFSSLVRFSLDALLVAEKI